MFCPNCGNQLPDGAKFCTRCGVPLSGEKPPSSGYHPPVNPSSGYHSPENPSAQEYSTYRYQGTEIPSNRYQPPEIPSNRYQPPVNHRPEEEKPKKSKKSGKILTSIIVMGAAYLVGSLLAKNIVAPSYEKNTEKPSQSYTQATEGTAAGYDNVKTKSYEIEASGVMYSHVSIIAYDDRVATITGGFSFYDTDLPEVAATVEELVSSARTTQNAITREGCEDMEIQIEETDGTVSVSFHFTDLNYSGKDAEIHLTAGFLGLHVTDGWMLLSKAEETLLANGYTLTQEI